MILSDFRGLGLTAGALLMLDHMPHDVVADGLSESRRHRIADLDGDTDFRTAPTEAVGECLQTGRFPVCDGAVFFGVQVSAFFGFVELRSDGAAGGLVPVQTAE